MSSEIVMIPSKLNYKSAPSVDQEISLQLNGQQQVITEYEKSVLVNLVNVYNNERQGSTVFRPTFKVNYVYNNAYIGTTNYVPFRDNLYYVDPVISLTNLVWSGYPQYYEFDFFRPETDNQHINYVSKSAYTYNWGFYISYPHENDYEKRLSCTLNNSTFNWVSSDGIPFVLNLSTENGSNIISFQCIMPHGLSIGESVELSISYGVTNVFEVYSLGNNITDSDMYIFNVLNAGYTGNTFLNGITGTFKRVINSQNLNETTSKYYIKKHKILTNPNDLIITKVGYEKNPFNEDKKLELNAITPNYVTRISQRNSSNTYTVTTNKDIDIAGLYDNQKRPITELFLTIINKGYYGYFNYPDKPGFSLKQGWLFNITKTQNYWWDLNNSNSNANILTSSYVLTDISGNTKIFYYNNDLMSGDTIDGDFCEWNEYEQKERVVSTYYQKINYNQNIFQTESSWTTNPRGFYYEPHKSITIKVFSDTVENLDVDTADDIPSWSFFSAADQQFRWRDLYEYGFIDDLGRGVDYPYLNKSHYPFSNVFFRLLPEGLNENDQLLGINVPTKPVIDECE
jgi:hypothetical protein